ncbi:Ig-like domain-containing protein [Serinibacter arcticus]|uniref:Ig-like domain-containing protein n=1 Tax=Serinibacter arcticus TaxID=1655435 RepID=UPI001304F8F1|nr:Ig-like domain-containing protein [Serinibacter arcticus]
MTNPVLNVAGFGANSSTGSAQFGSTLTIATPGITFGAPSAGATNLTIDTSDTRLRTTTARPSTECNVFDGNSVDGFAGCGSVQLNGTFSTVTFNLGQRISQTAGSGTWSAGSEDTIRLHVTLQDQPMPVANPDVATINAGQVATTNVLTNDTPATGLPLTAGSTTLLNAAGNPTSSVTNTAGTYTMSNGVVTFTPAAGFVGVAPPVSYRITDSAGSTATSTYIVTVLGGVFQCNDTFYRSDDGSIIVSVAASAVGAGATNTTFANFPAAVTSANAFGVSPDGTKGYWAGTVTGVTGTAIITYTAGSATPFTYAPAGVSPASRVAGAVNPVNGYYYFGGVSSGSALYMYNPTTGTTIQIGTSPGSAGANGDITFTGNGDMVILSNTTLTIVPAGNVRTTASTAQLTGSSVISASTIGTSDGIAFASDGFLYTNSGSQIVRNNPLSGATAGTNTPGGTFNDLGSCAKSPTVGVSKVVTGRTLPTDQFTLSLSATGVTSPPTGSTSGTATGVQTLSTGATVLGPLPGLPGATYTFAETSSAGVLARYATTYQCVDTANGNAVVASGNGTSFTWPFPATASGQQIVCSFTNGPNAPNLTLAKTAPTSLLVNAPATYGLTVTNSGQQPASAVQVRDQLPPNVAYTSATGATCTASGTVAAGQLVTCTVAGPIAANGGTANIGLVVTPNQAAVGTSVVNRAVVDVLGGTTSLPSACTANGAPSAGCAVTEAVTVIGEPLQCSATLYQISTTDIRSYATSTIGTTASQAGTLVDTLPALYAGTTALANSLAITSGGGAAYFTTVTGATGTVRVTRYDPVTDTYTDYATTLPASAARTSGAINPLDGSFYFGGVGAGQGLYRFDPATSTTVQVGVVSAPAGNANGDYAFTAGGDLVLLRNTDITMVPAASVPTTAGTGAVASTTLAVIQAHALASYNGIAFGEDGFFYVQSTVQTGAGQSYLWKFNPVTGALVGTQTLGATVVGTDLSSCSYPTTISLQKNIPARVLAGDQFGLSIAATGATTQTVTTSGGATGVQPVVAGPVLVLPGATKTLSETAAGTTVLGNYASSYQCIDRANGNAPVLGGTGTSFTFTGPATTGQDVLCTFTNAPSVPNLGLAKTGPPTLAVGTPATYNLTVTNAGTGPSPASVTVVDQLPAGAAFSSASGATCVPTGTVAAGQVVTCLVPGPIAAGGGTASFSITATPTAASSGTSVINRASVSPTGGTPVAPSTCTANGTPAGCAITPAVVVAPNVVLGLAKTNPASLQVGVASNYSFTVTNTGLNASPNATVVDVLPPNIAFNSAAGATCSVTGGTLATGLVVSCTVPGPIAASGGTASFTMNVTPQLASGGTIASNRAAVDPTGGTTPPNPATCSATGTPAGCAVTPGITVLAFPNLSLTKSNPAQLIVGQTATYSLTVANTGTAASPSATVSDVLPAGLTYASATGATCTATGQTVTCAVPGPIAVGASVPLTLTVNVTAAAGGTTVQNKAAVDPTGGTTPPNPATCTATGTPAGCAVAPLQPVVVVTANDDVTTTPPATPTTTTVLANDTVSPVGSLNPASVAITTAPLNGTATANPDGTITYTPNAGFSGTDSYTYSVCDSSAPTPICDTATVTITVPSTVTAVDDEASTPQNTPAEIPILSNDTITAGGSPLDPASVTITDGPDNGTVTFDPTTGLATYVPNPGFSGTDTFVYSVCDSSLPTPVCDTGVVTVTVGANTVTAADDSATTAPATPVTTTVLENDSSSTGQPFAPITIATPPANGTVVVNDDQTITYTPDPGFSGVDTYVYQLCDTSTPTPVCDTATVTVTVPNAVEAFPDVDTTTPATPVTVDVLGNDTVTPDGSPLDPASVAVTTQPANGTTLVNPDGSITYTPEPGFSGQDTFTYQVCDSSTPDPVCDSATVTVTIVSVVDAPDATETTPQNTPVTTSPVDLATTSPNGAPLDPASVTVPTGPANGTVDIDPLTGEITYTPDPNFSGTDTYTYSICDTSTPTPVCDTGVVTVTVEPNAVTAEPDAATTPAGTPVDIAVVDNDTVLPNGAPLDPASVAVTAPPAGGTVTIVDGVITYLPNPGFSGTDTFTYQVCDTSTPTPVCDTAVVTVAVEGAVTAEDDDATTAQNTPVTIDVPANDSSAGAPLDLGSVTIVDAPANGTVDIDPVTGEITYTPALNFSGTDTFTYSICDTSDPTPLCDTATVTVTVPANTVDAVDDSATTGPVTPVDIDLLDNDTVSPTGAPLDPASVELVTAPANGTLVIDPATGVATYTPLPGFSGTDSFVYSVCDLSVPTPVCDTATVTITVDNIIQVNDDTATVPQNTATDIPVLANDTTTGVGFDPATVAIGTGPANGTVTIDPATGIITYTPNANYSGPDTFTYTVCDTSPTPLCDEATVTVTVSPNVVTADDETATTPQNTPVTTEVLDGDTVLPNGAPLDPASVTVTTPAANGTTSVDPATGAITYTPNAGFSGTDTYSYTVCDVSVPTPVCDTATVTVTVPANVVTANPDTALTTPVTPVTTTVLDNDTVSPTGAPLDPASVAVTTPPAGGTTVVNPDGSITYTPNPGFAGTDTYTYTVCDTSNPTPVCDTTVVTVTVTNAVVANDDADSTPQNTPVDVAVLGNDTVSTGGPALDPASITTTAPANGTVTVDDDGLITYTPNTNFSGTETFTYTVCDLSTPTPTCDTATVTITVEPNELTVADDAATTPPATPVEIDVLENDSATGAPLDATSVTITTQPANGTVDVDPVSGLVTYTPNDGFAGVDTFVYSVCDISTPTPVCLTATVTVTVLNEVDAVDDTATTEQNTPVSVPVLGNDTQLDGGPGLDPASVTVTTPPANGSTLVDPTTGAVTYTPNPGFSGEDTFTYQVCDLSTPTPVCDSATVTVTIGENVVTAVDDADTTTPQTPVTTAVWTNDTVTPGGAPLDLASVVVATQPANGTVVANGDGTITYTPDAGFSGTDSYTYTICDTSTPDPVCDTATVTIDVVNVVVATDDTATVEQNGSVTTPVILNDTVLPGGAPLDPASVTITTDPENGTVTVNPDGSITYTPTPGFTGTDTYSYEVCDTSDPTPVCDTATATVTVEVGANIVVADDDSATTQPVTPVTIPVLENDSSSTGTPLTTVTIVDAPAGGTAVVKPDGTITYTPDEGFSGTDTFTYSVCDASTPTPVCDEATVTVTVPNVVTAVPDSATTPQNTPSAPIDVLGNDTVTPGAAPLDPTSVTIPTAPANGTVEVDPVTGEIVYTPNQDFSGTDSFTYSVCDTSTPDPVCVTATVTITVPANVVTAVPDTDTTTPGTPVTTPVLANDTVTTDGAPLDPASVTATAPPARGTVTVDPATGDITYTPNPGTSGTDTYTYQVCDTSVPTPVCASTTVTIEVVSTVVAEDDSASTPQNTAVVIDVPGNDSVADGGAPLDLTSVEVTTAPANGTTTVNPLTGEITYAPNPGFSGTDTFEYTICDTSTPTPVCDTATVTVTIEPNQLTLTPDVDTTAPATSVTTPVLANDSTTGAPLDPATVTVTILPANGSTAVDPATGTVTYTPNPGFSGEDVYTYSVCDTSTPTPVCDESTVTITVVNEIVAPDLTETTPQNTPVTTDVVTPTTVLPGGSLPDPASVAVTTQPANGTTTVDPATGAITYVPNPGFSGEDTYSFQICDGSTPTPVCDTGTVTVTVAPNTVTANPDTATTTPGAPVTTPVLGNDTTTPGGAPLDPATVEVTVPPTKGTVTVDPVTGDITYTPNPGTSGTDTYTYQVCDTSTPDPVCATAVVTVTVVNTVTAVDDGAITPQNTPVTVGVLGNDTVATDGAPLDPSSVTVTVDPANGTVTIDPATGEITYTPAENFSGTDTFTYSVCDTSTPTPVCDTATVTIKVPPNTVTAVPDTDTTTPGTPVTTPVLGNDTVTPGGAPLDPESVTITTSPTKGTVTVDPETGDITYTPTPGTSGTDTYTYQVCDTSTPEPVCATATVTIEVANTVTAIDDSVTTPQNTAVPIAVTANDTVATGGAPLDPASVAVTAPPANGTVTIDPATGVITYTPDLNFSGTDTFSYQVCDTSTPTPVCDTAVVTVTVPPNTVTALPDASDTTPGVPVTTPVLGNDTITPGGAPLDPASVTVTAGPTKGTVTVDPETGDITYTPNPGTSGTDTYTYQVCDTSVPTPVCSTAVVTIDVITTVTAVDDAATTPQNTPVAVDVLDNDTVADGGAPLDPASVEVTVAPANGTTAVDPVTGFITYTPAENFSGTDVFTYQVCDTSSPDPVCATATVTITVPPNTVTAVPDEASTTPATPVTTPVLDNDTVTPGGAPLDPATVTITTPPTKGTVTVDPGTGDITYTPNPGTSGEDSYSYTVCDTSVPTPVCSTATVTVQVISTVTAVDDEATTPQNTPVGITVLGNDTVSAGGAPLDPASVAVTTAPANGTVTVDPATGVITYTPNLNFSGTDTFSYQVCDTSTPTPVCDTAVVTVTVPANTVTALPDASDTTPGVPVTTPVLGNDTITPGGAPLDPATVAVTAGPTKGTVTVDPVTGDITYTPNPGTSGTDTFTYQVCDTSVPTPVCASTTVTVEVVSTVTAVDDVATTPQNTPVVIPVVGNDSVADGGAPLNPASVSVTTPPADGTVTIDPVTGDVTYTPGANFSGEDTFSYQVCDTSTPTPVCDTATVTVTVPPNTLTLTPDEAATTPGTPVAIPVLTNDTVTPGGAPLDPSSVEVTTPPTKGTVAVDPVTGVVTYTPTPGTSGTDTFTYTVCDTSVPTPVCASTTVTVTVPSTVTAVDDVASVPQNGSVPIPVIGNDTVSLGGAPLDPTSVTITAEPANGTVTVDPVTGVVTYTPTPGFSGEDVFSYQVCDTSTPEPVCDIATVTVTVGQNAVSANPDSATTPPGTAVEIPVGDNDTSGTGTPLDPTSVEIVTPPTKGTVTVDPETGVVTYTPTPGTSGTDTFTYTICDTSSPTPVCATGTVTVTVPNVVVANPNTATTVQDYGVTIPVIGNDTTSPDGAPLDPSSVVVTDGPANGTTTVNPDGSIDYTPNPGFTGTDTFTYQVCDTSTPEPVCASTTVTVTVAPTGIEVVKTAVPIDVDGDGILGIGDQIGYTFTVTNTGAVELLDVAVNDPMIGAVTCEATTLMAGESTTCTADVPHTITAADAEVGGVTNAASAVGTPQCTGPMEGDGDRAGLFAIVAPLFVDPTACPPITSETVTITTPVTPDDALTVAKSGVYRDANGNGRTDAGDTVTWTITVTNPGRSTISDIAVSDPTAGVVTCPTTELAAGASMTCTAPVTVLTAAQAAAGSIVNVATASGTTTTGTPTTSLPATATVTFTTTPPVPPVTPPKPKPPLPSTGADTWPLTGLAAALLVTGAVTLITRRRRDEA